MVLTGSSYVGAHVYICAHARVCVCVCEMMYFCFPEKLD